MATKLSEISAVTGTNNDDLVYLASTADGGSSYASKRITIANLFSAVSSGTDLGTFSGSTIADNASVKSALQTLETSLEAETANRGTAITAAIDAVIGSAPGTLDTLNEIAAAINDDANAFTTLTSSIAAVQADVDANETASDAAELALSNRVAVLEADPTTATALAAVQADVDQNESDADAAIAANEVHIDNLATLSGLAKDTTNFGSFTGGTLTSSATLKTLIQELETAVETKVTTGANVNTLVGGTVDQGEPTNFLFLVVDQSDGSIKVMNKNFVEVE